MSQHRAGRVGLIGRPNVGKSTLLNRVLGQKVAATANKPQTTRTRVAGIHTAEGYQAVLVDTPGLHKPRSRLNKAMVQAALDTLLGADLLVWLVDAAELSARVQKGGEVLAGGDAWIAEQIEAAEKPVILALNKADRIERPSLLPVLEACHARLPAAVLVPISALKGEGVDGLLAEIGAHLPEGEALYPEDQLVEGTERSLVAEIIREKVVRLTERELPYVTAVEVEQFDESERDAGLIRIHARILVERSSQKGIVIGRGGSMLKRIGTQARRDVESLLGCHVHLELFVAVEEDWTRNPRLLHELGYE
ncbi:MAG: GTPase Era [Pseudomonadota bacterium]